MQPEAPQPAARPSPPRPRLLTSAAFAVVGNAFYHGCQLGVLVLLAKFAGPAVQGQYLLALALSGPVLALFGLELRGALVSDADRHFTFGTYHRLRQLLLAPALLVLGAAVLWQGVVDAPPPAYLLILGGMFVARMAWSWADIGWGVFQQRERLDFLAVAVGLRGLTLLLPFGLLLPLGAFSSSGGGADAANTTALAVVLHAAGMLALIWLYDRPRVHDPRHVDARTSWPAVRALALQTLPLGAVALMVQLADALPRLVIEDQPHGKENLGYFGSLAYLTLAGNLIIIQTAMAAAHRLSRAYHDDLRAFLRLNARLLALALGLGLGVTLVVVLWGNWLLRVLYTAEYARFKTELVLIVIANSLALLTNVFGIATTQMRLFWLQVPVQVVTLLATAVAAGLLIPGPRPVTGAAYTALVRATVQLLLYGGCMAYGLLVRERAVAAYARGRGG